MTMRFTHPLFNTRTRFNISRKYTFRIEHDIGMFLKDDKIVAKMNKQASRAIDMISKGHPLQHIIKMITYIQKDIDNLISFIENMIQLGFLKVQGEST